MTFTAYKSYILMNQAGVSDPVKLETLNEASIVILKEAIPSLAASLISTVAVIAALSF